jgi:hypothetical protein
LALREIVMSNMTLNVGDRQTVHHPSDADIRAVLAALNVDGGDAFAILGPDEMTYIQASGDRNVGFDLEYQDGSAARHYRATTGAIPLDDVVSAFVAYRDDRADWRAPFNFEKMTR